METGRENGDRETWLSGPGLPPKLRLRFFILISELPPSSAECGYGVRVLKSSATKTFNCSIPPRDDDDDDDDDPNGKRSHVPSSVSFHSF